MSFTPSSVSQRSGATKGSITVRMPMVAAASNTTWGSGVGIEPSGVQSSSDSNGAWPVGDASPAASSAVRISSGRRTKSKASTFFRPIAASRVERAVHVGGELLGEGVELDRCFG